MTVRKRAIKTFKHLNIPVSYKVLDDKGLSDSRNVFDNKGVTETRYGLKRYNTTSLGGAILSTTFFKKSDGTKYKLAKVGTILYSVSATGAATAIKTGLSATTKHRAVTLNDRHIIAIESDGLFSFNGTVFTQLGQAAPATGTATIGNGGSLPTGNNFKIGLTFYASATGFESNVFESNQVSSSGSDLQINISSIPATASNGTIDKVRIYLKNTTSNTAYLYIDEINLGTTTYSVTGNATSTIIPPTKNAPPISGGGKYIALFGKKIAYSGNATFLNDVYFSEEYLPDAFDGNASSQVILQIPGQGPITGIGTGMYDQQFLNPFLAIFKKSSAHIYSELNQLPNEVMIDDKVGCVSNDTIKIRNGGVFFMSQDGWRGIVNGKMIQDQYGRNVSLGNEMMDDIFSRVGATYELNIAQASSFFSTYYSPNIQYMTFVSEGASTEIKKAYVFEEAIGGFRIYEFKTALTCGCEGEDDLGYQTIFLGDSTGTLFTYSNRNSRHDEDNSGNSQTIPAYALLPYILQGDDASTYNFRTLAVRALTSSNLITVKTFPSFSTQIFNSFSYDVSNSSSGFTLDVSELDVDSFGDERTVTTAMADLNQTGEVILIGFYQDILDANIGLVSAQLTSNKNGSRNIG